MITKINESNAAAYKNLFGKMDKVFGWDDEPENQIASLDEYFEHIAGVIEEQEGEKDLRFVVLPLDEPAFEINANTRLITVPAEFRNNGISVQGDEGAEIVYFKIDRYFDATDLGAPDTNILIQWETAPNGNGRPEAGTSNALIRDIKSEPGKLIFGWYLDNSITQYPGSIKFAVRIFKMNTNGEMTYNFSTLVANANIQPSLDYDLADFYRDDTPEQWILNRLIDSPQQEETTVANKPVFILNLPDYAEAERVELDNTGNRKLKVKVTTGDAGIVSFVWNRWNVNEDGEVNAGDIVGSPDNLAAVAAVEYLPTDDAAFDADHIYYIEKNVNGAIGREVIPSTSYTVGQNIEEWCAAQTDAGNAIQKSAILEMYGTCVASSTGFYQVTAKNRVGKSNNSQASAYAIIPGPTSDHIFAIAPASVNGVNEINGGVAHVFLVDDVENEGKGIANPKIAVDHDVHNTTTYAWKKGTTDLNTNAESVPVSVDDADRANYDEVFEVAVFDTRNKDVTATKAVKFRVTDYAKELSVSDPYDVKGSGNKQFSREYAIGHDLVVRLNMTDAISDELQYQWYKYIADKDEDGNVLINDPENDQKLVGEVSDTYVPTAEGSYYCEVTNCIKDGEEIVSSKSFLTPLYVVA